MQKNASFPRLVVQLINRTLLSLLIAESALLSLLHHRYNFWGWPWDKQVLVILIIAPGLAYVLQRLWAPIWPDFLQISAPRWILFLVPATAIAALAAWHFLAMPETQHQLEIVPAEGQGSGELRLLEVKGAYGNEVPLLAFSQFPGWRLQAGLLTSADGQSPQPIRYSFLGPVGEQVRVTFLASPQGGHAQVILDGQTLALDLAGPDGDQRRARLDTQYRWGLLNFLIIPLIMAADLLTLLWLLAALWLIQEVAQNRRALPEQALKERFLSHRDGLLLLCLIGLVLHTVYFLTVPLVVSDDGASYLQGAIYWIRFHSLDGVSSYRGPGTTFLFTPFIFLFGRNPWGVKMLLHLIAVACIPLSYRLGWQFGKRRWFAFCMGLTTALLPDLYPLSSYVLSEVPNALFGLLYCTLLISALETLSPWWIAAAALAGSFAVLVRSENSAALLIGIGFIVAKLLWVRKTVIPISQNVAARKPLATVWQIALLILIAVGPLLAWSAHNQKIYGFFGISNYAGEILYDGWIYFGENSRMAITDQDSSAVRAITAAYPFINKSKHPTGWDIYHALLGHGYTSEQAFSILGQAALDSIRRAPGLSLRLLVVKIEQGFQPQAAAASTFALSGESPPPLKLNAPFFDHEAISIPALISVQRSINSLVFKSYPLVFTAWFWLGLTMVFISLYHRPFFRWVPLAVIATNSVFFATVMGIALWRYLLFGTILMPIFILAGIQLISEFIPHYLNASHRSQLQSK